MPAPKNLEEYKKWKNNISVTLKKYKRTQEHEVKLAKARKCNNSKYRHSLKTKEKQRQAAIKIWACRNRFKLTKLQEQEKEAGRKKPKQCEISGEYRKLCFDHDHITGKFRGWICTRCNVALGMANDDTKVLQKLITYLK